MNNFLSGGFGVIVILFLFILAILWFLLPFAIFGTKDKLTELILETRKTNVEIAKLAEEMKSLRIETNNNNSPI